LRRPPAYPQTRTHCHSSLPFCTHRESPYKREWGKEHDERPSSKPAVWYRGSASISGTPSTWTKIAQGRPKLWAKFKALIGIYSQSVGQSLAIWANPVQFSLEASPPAHGRGTSRAVWPLRDRRRARGCGANNTEPSAATTSSDWTRFALVLLRRFKSRRRLNLGGDLARERGAHLGDGCPEVRLQPDERELAVAGRVPGVVTPAQPGRADDR
jgi:hypothetical protein